MLLRLCFAFGFCVLLPEPQAGEETPLSPAQPPKDYENKRPPLAALHFRPADLDGDTPAHLIPWVSESWKSQFKWDGTGAMPDDERKKLREFVAKAHKQGRKVRFWATPEKPAVWKELLAADVDFLN